MINSHKYCFCLHKKEYYIEVLHINPRNSKDMNLKNNMAIGKLNMIANLIHIKIKISTFIFG